MTDEPDKFVLRSPQKASASPPSDTTARPWAPQDAAPTDPTPPSSEPQVTAAPADVETVMSQGGSLPPVTISEVRERPPVPEPTVRKLGMVLLGIGGTICCLFPTFSWFRYAIGTLQIEVAMDLPAVSGVRSWAGLVCLAGGLTIMGCLIAMQVPRGARDRETLGIVAGTAGILTAGIALYAATSPASAAGEAVLRMAATPWVIATIVGGILAAVGGFLVRD